MTEQRYRVSDRPQRTPGAVGDERDWFAPGAEVTREDEYGLDSDGEWRVHGKTLPNRGGLGHGYIRPDALDPITEPDTGLPDVRWLNAALMALGYDWKLTGQGILDAIDLARKIEQAVNRS